MTALAVDRGKRRRGVRLLPMGVAAALAVGLVGAHGETCYALAAEAYRSVTDSYLVMWVERTGSALGCF